MIGGSGHHGQAMPSGPARVAPDGRPMHAKCSSILLTACVHCALWTCCEQVQPFKAHKIEPPSNKVETTVGELRSIYHTMYRMRRMEIAADMMYKAKLIRGFCHL